MRAKKSNIWVKAKRYALTVPQQKAFLDYIERTPECRGWPTLIIAGSDDKPVGNDALRDLRNGIADSELFVYEGQVFLRSADAILF